MLGTLEASELRRVASQRERISVNEEGQAWWFTGHQLHAELLAFIGLPEAALESTPPGSPRGRCCLDRCRSRSLSCWVRRAPRASEHAQWKALKQAAEQLGQGVKGLRLMFAQG